MKFEILLVIQFCNFYIPHSLSSLLLPHFCKQLFISILHIHTLSDLGSCGTHAKYDVRYSVYGVLYTTFEYGILRMVYCHRTLNALICDYRMTTLYAIITKILYVTSEWLWNDLHIIPFGRCKNSIRTSKWLICHPPMTLQWLPKVLISWLQND